MVPLRKRRSMPRGNVMERVLGVLGGDDLSWALCSPGAVIPTHTRTAHANWYFVARHLQNNRTPQVELCDIFVIPVSSVVMVKIQGHTLKPQDHQADHLKNDTRQSVPLGDRYQARWVFRTFGGAFVRRRTRTRTTTSCPFQGTFAGVSCSSSAPQ